jgi:hypothetical protein
MTKTAVRDIKVGQLIKVTREIYSETESALVPAHTKKAAPARIVGIERSGRYTFIETDMGTIMIGAAGKVTIV